METAAAKSSAVLMADDALLEQVDEQVSEGVPQPLESLTHLVSSSTAHSTTQAKGASSAERN